MSAGKKTSFATSLRELRAKAGMTQVQLAQQAGLHLSAVTRFEQGSRGPSLASAAKLAAALGVKVDDLLKPLGPKATQKKRSGRPR